jgi:alpha-D-xyloside xylohydrolase
MKKHLSKTLFLKFAAFLIVSQAFLQSARASVISYTKNADGIVFKLDKGLMNIRVCKADIIEVKYTIFEAFPAKSSLVVNNAWREKTPFTVSERGGKIIISTSKLNITINKTTNAITYSNKSGVL